MPFKKKNNKNIKKCSTHLKVIILMSESIHQILEQKKQQLSLQSCKKVHKGIRFEQTKQH